MNKELGILDLTLIFAKRRKFIIVFTLIAALAAIVYSLLAPHYFKSRASLIPIVDNESIGAISGSITDLIGGSFIKTPKSEYAVDFITVMKSRTFRENVVREFDLIPYFKIKKPPMEAMEKAIYRLQSSLITLEYDNESYLLTIVAETKDKTLSKEIVEFYLKELEDYNQNHRNYKSKMKRAFLEEQVNKHMKDVDSLAVAVKEFQEKNKAIALEMQTDSGLKIYSQIVTELLQSEIELELARTQYSEQSIPVQQLKQKYDLLKDRLDEMEKIGGNLGPDYLIQIDKVPDLGMQWSMLKMNAEIKKTVVEFLYPQYELARLEEERDMPSFQVLDAPQEAGRRSKPKRAIIVIVCTLAAGLLSLIIALIIESAAQNKEKIDQISKILRGKDKE
ncbi:MAG: GumC family protein [Candidatus Cloacimonadaceae bacterium]